MNSPDSLVESSRFKKLISIAHLVSSDYKPPGRKKIGGKDIFIFSYCWLHFNIFSGEILDLNFKTIMASNKKKILQRH